MTKRENYTALLEIVTAENRADLVEFINHEIELLNKKNSSPKKPTAKQVENEKIKDEILSILTNGKMTVTEITTALNREDVSPQRVSAIITQLKEDNSVVRTVEKRKAYFSLA